MIYLETPANPNNALFDMSGLSEEIGDYYQNKNEKEVIVAVDNTYMGPIWQHPLEHGADLTIYSATKYIGGHSDLIAGAVMGRQELMTRVKTLRTFLGNMISPNTAWLLLRSLETLKLRMDKQCDNAQKVAGYLITSARNNNGILYFDCWNFNFAKCCAIGTFGGATITVIEKHNA